MTTVLKEEFTFHSILVKNFPCSLLIMIVRLDCRYACSVLAYPNWRVWSKKILTMAVVNLEDSYLWTCHHENLKSEKGCYYSFMNLQK